VKAVLHERSPASAVVDLVNDVPAFDVTPAAHLLAALAARLPRGAVTIAVVDPGVGSSRGAVAAEAEGRWFLAPDNGLVSVAAARARAAAYYDLPPLEEPLCASFHGRDFFAPHAAALATGALLPEAMRRRARLAVELGAGDLEQIIYCDHYGNAMTGIRASRPRRLIRSSCTNAGSAARACSPRSRQASFSATRTVSACWKSPRTAAARPMCSNCAQASRCV
jgi:S-adenosylmethionine hydrolase